MSTLPSFGEDLLQGFLNGPGLKDYSHASKTFRSDNYNLSPRTKYLFHVFFNLNMQIPAIRNAFGSNGDTSSIGLMVKTIDLPKYTIDVDTMNQYNRKRLVQTKINYDPVNVSFHDDQGDLIRNMWYQYYAYYYKDPTQPYNGVASQNGTSGLLAGMFNGSSYNTSDIYSPNRQSLDWGFAGEGYTDNNQGTASGANSGKPPFFTDITIYGLAGKQYASYTLINPIITNWNHDTYSYAEGGGTMANQMTIRYESVKYFNGAVGGATPSNTVNGFADPNHYDTVKSRLARPGSTATVFGQGGIIDALTGSVQDLQALASGQGGLAQIIGLAQTASTTYNTFKGKDIASIASTEAQQAAISVLQQGLPGSVRQAVNSANGFLFPKAPPVYTQNNNNNPYNSQTPTLGSQVGL